MSLTFRGTFGSDRNKSRFKDPFEVDPWFKEAEKRKIIYKNEIKDALDKFKPN